MTPKICLMSNAVHKANYFLLRLSDRGSRLERLNHLFGIWQNEPEIDLIFTELDRQRHNDYGRNIDSFD